MCRKDLLKSEMNPTLEKGTGYPGEVQADLRDGRGHPGEKAQRAWSHGQTQVSQGDTDAGRHGYQQVRLVVN